MKNLKLMLLGFILFVFCIKTSYGEIVRISKWVLGSVNYAVVDVVCEHIYSNKEIKVLEKAADQGDSLAQLKLAIFYDNKAMQRYNQILENKNVTGNSKKLAQTLTKQRLSPCMHKNNNNGE